MDYFRGTISIAANTLGDAHRARDELLVETPKRSYVTRLNPAHQHRVGALCGPSHPFVIGEPPSILRIATHVAVQCTSLKGLADRRGLGTPMGPGVAPRAVLALVGIWRLSVEVVAMNVAQGLWASIQGDPVFMRRVNGWLTIFWIVMIPIALITGWVTSVVFVSALSLWALVAGHWSAWQAARVEVAQEAEIQKRAEQHPEKEIVDAIVRETDVSRETP